MTTVLEQEEEERQREEWQETTELVIKRTLVVLRDKQLPLTELVQALRNDGTLDEWKAWYGERKYSEDEIDEQLVDDVREMVMNTRHVRLLEDSDENESVVATATALDGIVLTHRLTERELQEQYLVADPDLSFIDFDCDSTDKLVFAGGGEFRYDGAITVDEPGGVYRGDTGWLAVWNAGDLLAVSRSGNTISIRRLHQPEASGDAEATALRAAFDELGTPGYGDEMMNIGIAAVAANSSLFRTPVPPIAELLAQAGLVHDSPEVGLAGEQWTRRGELGELLARRLVILKRELKGCCARAFDTVAEAFVEFDPANADAVSASPVLQAFMHEDVMPAFVEHQFHRRLSRMSTSVKEKLFSFVRSLQHGARDDEERAFAWTLIGLFHDEVDDCADADTAYRMAISLLRDAPVLAYVGAANYASYRGDAITTRQLLHRVAHDELSSRAHNELHILDDAFQVFDKAGRNDRCPCGSGRKLKVCCASAPSMNDESRERWLFHRLLRFTSTGARSGRPGDLMLTAFGLDMDTETMDDPNVRLFLATIAVFEPENLDAYMSLFGEMLDTVDRERIESWKRVPFALWELVSTEGQAQMRFYATGESYMIKEGRAPVGGEVGDLYAGRFIDRGDGLYPFGGVVPVPPEHRDATVELLASHPGVIEIAQWYGKLDS